VKDWRIVTGVVGVVIVVWIVGAAVTKYSLEQMAYFAPLAVVVVGATAALIMLWVKVGLQLRDDRRERRAAERSSSSPRV
jgi:hypothetical protein